MTAGPSVGIVGTGRMGGPMARNLLEAGFDVTAFDVDEEALSAVSEAGATAVETPRALESTDVVLLVVPTGDHVREVCFGTDGLFESFGDGYVVVTSSVRPQLPFELQREAPDGVTILDAPMCRGAAAAERGEILFLLGGSERAVETCKPILETCGAFVHLGGLGAGQMGKTANNLLLWISILGDYEVLRLAEEHEIDVDPLALRRVLPLSSGDNWAIREGNWESLRLTWPEKDLAIALDLADEADSPLPVSGLVSQLIKPLEVEDLERYYIDGDDE